MKNKIKTIYSAVLLLVSLTLQAQETFPDDTQDVPVNDYIPLFILVGIGLAYWFFKKKQVAN